MKISKKRIYCPTCKRLVGECDNKTQIDKVYRCKKCNKMVVYHVSNGEIEVKDISQRTCSSGMIFI